ncbi:T6SS effector amidase Tae4 family protein [Duganella sp. Root336D2]|uniref:T6SS effector amidase Tae4 family protein n=1 Tax=unclassified Duganella TaxID=2636909 RepID=UPI001E386D0C|nr:T6SS effector amidase Tae4 family protein [Duganella sp. Root336D2]
MKLAGRNGIVIFETSGYLGATGHFTLWDGKAMELAFAPGPTIARSAAAISG